MVTKKKNKKIITKRAVKKASKTTKGIVKAQKATITEPEFQYIPASSITVMEQVRSNINSDSDSFKALVQSIKDKGILEPVIVTPKGDNYLLICGERRYLAAQELSLESIPARIINAVTRKDEILAFQLTENLQREDLNPIDQAKGILAYFQAKHPNKGYDADGIMNELMSYNLRPDSVAKEIAETVSAIVENSGKTSKSLYNILSLTNLSLDIRSAISQGTLPVSQGYLFAANLDCPDSAQIFEDVMVRPVTNATLTNLLTAWKKPKPDAGDPKIIPMTRQVVYLRTTRSFMEMGKWQYNKPDLRIFIEELQTLLALAEQKILTAPEPEPDKKKPDNRPQV